MLSCAPRSSCYLGCIGLYLMCGTYYNFHVGKIRETNIRETNILFSYLLQQYKMKYYNKQKIL